MTSGPRRPRRSPRSLLIALLAALIALGAVAAFGRNEPFGDPGRLVETTWAIPAEVPLPQISDATEAWHLERRPPPPDGLDATAGGLAAGDLDGDGDLDLAVAQGSVQIYLWKGDRFSTARDLGVDDAVAVTIADVDGDDRADLLVARDAASDVVVWGGAWIGKPRTPTERLELPGANPSSGLIAAELSGDTAIDIVRLGRGEGARSVLWVADPADRRAFSTTSLGSETGPAMAGEIADVDDDGLADVWVTRDVGWAITPDSVYSRRGDPSGPWADVADELGGDRAIDGMGVTIADLDGDHRLDAYLSDLGDNEVLIRRDDGFEPMFDTGAARIRPPGASNEMISSSWASGASDVNLDGRLDLVVANGGFESGGVRNKVAGADIALVDPPAVLLGLGDGRFADAWPQLGVSWDSASRGLTIADFDADGDDDYVFIGTNGSLRALRNDTRGSSVTITPAPGCHPVGAVATVDQGAVSARWLLAANTYAGAHSPAVIVGLRPSVNAVTVAWPDGITTAFATPDPSSRSTIVAGCDGDGDGDGGVPGSPPP